MKLVGDLLTNVYRAFDYRTEEEIYDTLDQSVAGDLLTEVYLEVQGALQLEGQGGASTKVSEVQVLSSEPKEGGEEGTIVTRCQWTVTGSIGHWGHVHTRTNKYDAELTIRAEDGRWQLTGMELLEEERL